VVFDVTRIATFEAATKWKSDIDSTVTVGIEEKPIPVVLLANKMDLAREGFSKSQTQMDQYCKQHEFAGWFETSAKDNMGIEKAAKFLISKILENQVTQKLLDQGIVHPSEKETNLSSNDREGCCLR